MDSETVNVLKIEAHETDIPAMYIRSVRELTDYEATLGYFLGLENEECWLTPGLKVTITVVAMSREELASLPDYEEVI